MFRSNELIDNTYQILKELGAGGAGVVYLAYHVRLQKYVVVKKIKDGVTEMMPSRKEADILKNLHHPNLPQVYDFVQDEGGIYTVIDFVEGTDLATYMREGYDFSEQQLLFWFYQIAQVLDYLHSQSTPIYHCDIKPENIMITPDGNAILIDFNVSLSSQYLSLLGVTPAYASPEQLIIAQEISTFGASDEFIDGRSDIYSLGATFYHAMTRVRPIPNQVMQPLVEQELGYSESFCRIVDRSMAYDREKRYENALKLLSALERSGASNRKNGLMFATRCLSILLSAALIATGAYFLVTGAKLKKHEAYVSKLTAAFSALSDGDMERTEDLCFEILNGSEYKGFLNENPKERAQLLHALGEVEYQNQRYATAAEQYERAFRTLPRTETELRSKYLRDATVSYAESGDLSKAQLLIDEASDSDLDDVDMLLVQAVLAAKNGNGNQAAEYAQQLLDRTSDEELCARAAMAVASASSNPETELKWLKIAEQYKTNKTLLRALASANVRLSLATYSEAVANDALRQACSYYEELTSDAYPSKTDWINYSVVLRMMRRFDEAIQSMERQLSVYPDDYRILTQLAFATHEKGDISTAKEYCASALQAWKADRSPDREDQYSENIQNLNSLAEMLGVGGVQ